MGTAQYKRALICRVKNLLTHLRLKLGVAERRYESDFGCKASFCPIGNARGLVYVDRPLRTLPETIRPQTRRLGEDIRDVSRGLLPKSEKPY